MGSQINFTQLYGETCDAPLSSLLEINGFTFLIDCGWTEAFDVATLNPLKEAVPRIDAVLLSHPDTAHLGALPYAIGHLGLKVPIYATQPTCRMGQMFMYDQYLSHHANSEFEHFDLDDVDTAFDYQTVHQLKFQQNMKLTGQLPCGVLVLHMLPPTFYNTPNRLHHRLCPSPQSAWASLESFDVVLMLQERERA